MLDGVAEIVLAQLSVDTADPDCAAQLHTVAHHFRQLALAHSNVVPLLVTRPLAVLFSALRRSSDCPTASFARQTM